MPDLIDFLDPYELRGHPMDRTMRQSRLNQLGTCQKRVEFDIKTWAGPATGPARFTGQVYHAGIEYLYRNWDRAGDVPDTLLEEMSAHARGIGGEELAKVGERWLPDADNTTVEQCFERALEALQYYVVGGWYWPSTYTVVGVEVPFWAPFPREGWIMHGTLDLWLVDQLGNWHFVDHKSAKNTWKKGKHTPRSTKQMPVYVKYMRQVAEAMSWDVPPIFCHFDIVTLGKWKHLKRGDEYVPPQFERRAADPTEGEIAATQLLAETACQLIENDGPWFPNQDSFLCSHQYCDHWEICPFGASFSTGSPVELTEGNTNND